MMSIENSLIFTKNKTAFIDLPANLASRLGVSLAAAGRVSVHDGVCDGPVGIVGEGCTVEGYFYDGFRQVSQNYTK